MKLTPLDIYNKEFKKKFSVRGYDGQEVDEFLDHVAASNKKALKEVGAPTNAQELEIEPKYILEALEKAHEIRPNRYTILRDGIGRKKAEEVAEKTGVI